LNIQGNTVTPNGILDFDTGTHILSASYSGDSSFNPSDTTQSLTFTITPGFYAMIPPFQSTVLISAPGGTGQKSVFVSYSSGFHGNIALACSGLPSGATCVFAPPSFTPTGTAGTTTVVITVTTKAATAMSSSRHRTFPALWMTGLGLLVAGLLVNGKRQCARGSYLLLVLILLIVVPGCGGGGSSASHNPPPDAGTPTGVSTVVVTATSGSIQSTASFTLVVQ
jgi:hypothetical protein